MLAPSPTARSPLDADALRAREFPALVGSCYLNAASHTPIPERTRSVAAQLAARRARVHELGADDFDGALDRARAAAAGLIGAGPDEIALAPNTSFGLNIAAHCLAMEAGQAVVVSDREFPANVYPWMRQHTRGVRVERVPTDVLGRPDEDRILERLDGGDVAVFALSAVQFATGYRADLVRFGQACRERGIRFVVDGIQALGQLPLDVREAQIDILASGGHKWLCSPFGTGFAYIRRELLPELEPHFVGWTGMEACTDLNRLVEYRYEFRTDARRFEAATPGFQDFAGFATSLGLLCEIGVERIQQHQRALLDPLIEALQARPDVQIVTDLTEGRRSGILCFRPADPEGTFAELARAGVVCVLREGAIRISPHLYNTPDDLARVTEVVAGVPR